MARRRNSRQPEPPPGGDGAAPGRRNRDRPPGSWIEELPRGSTPPPTRPGAQPPGEATAPTAGSPLSPVTAVTAMTAMTAEEEEPSQPAVARTVRLTGRFATAAAALVFADQVESLGRDGSLAFARSASSGTWWTTADLPVDVGREMVAAARGTPYVLVDDMLLPDKGWGPLPTPPGLRRRAAQTAPKDLRTVSALDLVLLSGLHQARVPVPDELVVLLPGARVAALIQRALDFGLTTGYRLARLEPLLSAESRDQQGRDWGWGRAAVDGAAGNRMAPTGAAVFEVVLGSPSGLPATFLAALDRDPFALVCRRAGPALLIQYQTTSALPDRQLARFVEREGTKGVWVLADAAFGCHRLFPAAEDPHADGGYRDGAHLVRLADTYQLTSGPTGWPGGELVRVEAVEGVEPLEAVKAPTLRLVRSGTRGVAVDAVLLDDDDLSCVPALLEGQPLADFALFVRGRDRHLLFAPGGLLERLPFGEALYRIGPGPLYLPLGHRLQPALPPAARQSLFPVDEQTAVVLIRSDQGLAFDLNASEAVWTLWAGPIPPIDLQLPRAAAKALAEVDRLTAPPPSEPAEPVGERRSRFSRAQLRELFTDRPADKPRTWRDEAWAAERAKDYEKAAELHEANNDLRRAAHLYELSARQGPPRRREPEGGNPAGQV